LRERLDAGFVLHPLSFDLDRESTDGTRKFLWRRASHHRDSGSLESVLIPDGDRVTYCISTQSGCPVKCTFCATGYGGFTGNLDAAEIVDQVLQMRTRTQLPPTNLVYMGMGEPLLNYDAVARSLEILTHDGQVRFGARRITVSTVGVPDRIRQLGRDFPQVKLALSLHAANDELRDELIPLNRKHPLHEVLDAVREHCRLSGKQVTFEYVVLPGVNDSDEDAAGIVRRIRGIPSHINLIGFNPFDEAPYEKPKLPSLLRFRDSLAASYDGAVTVRRSRGEDIQGACGQLSLARKSETD
jgi:23S rRNA (adenine2503-C2)-methyltransferase